MYTCAAVLIALPLSENVGSWPAAATGVSDLELCAVLGGGSERIKPHTLQFARAAGAPGESEVGVL